MKYKIQINPPNIGMAVRQCAELLANGGYAYGVDWQAIWPPYPNAFAIMVVETDITDINDLVRLTFSEYIRDE